MECIANHQSVQMKNRLMARDISPFFWVSSKGGIYQRALSGFCIQKKRVIGQKVCVTNPNKLENL